ncbi:MAG TPA: hypothetical protein VEZ42_12965, partial [Pseudonocardia sp.]|nr:hypothetical protein [Pseudonocardia sp.]
MVALTDVRAGEGIAVSYNSPHFHQYTAATSLPPLPQLDPLAARVTGLARYANPAPRHLGPALLIGAVVAAGSAVLWAPGWAAPGWAAPGVLAAVVVWVVSSLLGAAGAERAALAAQRRRIRAAVLDPLDRVELAPGEQSLATLLDPRQALLPLQGRRAEKTALLGWCRDAAAGPVRILSGPSGVGKTRLAVEAAAELTAQGWAAGRCAPGRTGQVFDPVVACAEPTLIVVDDADTEPGVPGLIQHATTHNSARPAHRVKVLLVVRDGDAYQHWLTHHPDNHVRRRWPHTALTATGAAGDRRRWFVQAARAAATALGLDPPAVSDIDARPVGIDGEPMVVTEARAVLAARAGSRARIDALRTAGIDAIATELVALERRRWEHDALRNPNPQWNLPADLNAEHRATAVLALVLHAPTTPDDAAAVLRGLPALADRPRV